MKPFRRTHRLLIAAALAAAAACSTKSPTEPSSPPITSKPPAPVTTFSITITANPNHLTIGTTTGSKITVQAVDVATGLPPPDLTPVTLTTTLGEFNAPGTALQTLSLQFVHGLAQATLFPGTIAGTATLGATSPSSATVVFQSGVATVVISSPAVTTFSISVTANPNHLTAGGTSGSKITVQAANVQGGAPPPDLTAVTLTTTLGEFNAVGSGLQTLSLQLVHGQAQAVLFPGTSAGTATLGAKAPDCVPSPCAPGTPVFLPGAATVVIGSPGTFFLSSLSPSTGDPSGGTLVTIVGGGFQAPVSVTFGGSSAPVKSVSPSSIQVFSPPSATPVPVGSTQQVSVTVNNNVGGTLQATATLTNAFTYVPGGGGVQQPQVFSVTPASGTNDGGTRVTIAGEGFVAPVQVFFGAGTSAASFNGIEATIQSVTATQVIVVTPPARGFGQDNTNQLVSILVKNTGSGFATIDTAAFKYGSKVIITSAGPTVTDFNKQVKVTIFGQGFADPVAVSLGPVAAQVLSTSGTEIEVLSEFPQVTGCTNVSGPIHVTNINNGDSADGPPFTYLVPKPGVVSVSPSTGPASGEPVDILGANFIPGNDQVQFGTMAVAVGAGSTSTDLKVTAPAVTLPTVSCTIGNQTGTQLGPLTVNVTVTDAFTGCTATLTGGFTYEPPQNNPCVPPPPPAPVASCVASMPGPGNCTVNFTDTSTGNPTSWTWNFADGSATTSENFVQNPTHKYLAPGTYPVTLRVSGPGGPSAGPGSCPVTLTGPCPP